MSYHQIIQRLAPIYGIGEARAIVRLVLDHLFGMSLTDIMLGKVNELSREDTLQLEKIIVRLENNEPVQYILGYQEFCGHTFHVAPGVLIPRPETELLVEHANTMAHTIPASSQGAILDIGTGSGCIAISIALANPSASVHAWDISLDALNIAQQNAKNLGANVAFHQVDALTLDSDNSNIDAETSTTSYSLIVSNPPYICQKEANEMERNVLDHEPHNALFVPDEDPLLFYRAIGRFAYTALNTEGCLLFEVNRAYASDVATLLKTLGFRETNIIKDQFDNDRIVTCRK